MHSFLGCEIHRFEIDISSVFTSLSIASLQGSDSASSWNYKNKRYEPTLATVIWHSFGSPSHGNQRRKRNKRNPRKRRSMTVLFADDTILYIENPKDVIRKLLELINEFNNEK